MVTLLQAVQSLGFVELATVSWINIRQIGTQHVAIFTLALMLPFRDPRLPQELRRAPPRFWPDQRRLLEGAISIQDQIQELQSSKILGNLDFAYVPATKGNTSGIWIIETHAGNDQEREVWLRSVIALEGRPTAG